MHTQAHAHQAGLTRLLAQKVGELKKKQVSFVFLYTYQMQPAAKLQWRGVLREKISFLCWDNITSEAFPQAVWITALLSKNENSTHALIIEQWELDCPSCSLKATCKQAKSSGEAAETCHCPVGVVSRLSQRSFWLGNEQVWKSCQMLCGYCYTDSSVLVRI